MKISEIKSILNAELICGEEFIENEVHTACGSDMMSDVLAYVNQAIEKVKKETGLVFSKVLQDAGVYKNLEDFNRFIDIL